MGLEVTPLLHQLRDFAIDRYMVVERYIACRAGNLVSALHKLGKLVALIVTAIDQLEETKYLTLL